MRTSQFIHRATAFALLTAFALPTLQPAFATTPDRIADVGLTSAGALVGQVVDHNGKPLANSPVAISASGQAPTEAKTNDQGYFSIEEVRAGVYVASAPGTSQLVRVWAPRTAPPSASEGILLVQSDATARAQRHPHLRGAHDFLHNNWKPIAAGLALGAGLTALLDYNKDSGS